MTFSKSALERKDLILASCLRCTKQDCVTLGAREFKENVDTHSGKKDVYSDGEGAKRARKIEMLISKRSAENGGTRF